MGNIVLNGKLYDSATGQLIHAPVASRPATPKPKLHKNGHVIDGVMHHPRHKHATKAKPQPKRIAVHVKKAPKAAPVAPQTVHTAVPIARHKPQRPATLMRHAVSKPAAHPVKHTKPASIHDARTAERLARAKAIPKSQAIARFPATSATKTHTAQRSVPTKHAAVAVEAAPKAAAPPMKQPATHKPHPAPAPMTASEKLVTNALKNARAHEASHPYAKKPRRRFAHAFGIKNRTANIAMATAAVVLLGGFFVYQNIPNFSMRLASARAGFAAAQPGYRPSGFTQDKLVSYAPGKVTISFHSNSDSRKYQVTQQVSNWNSQALSDNYLAANNKQYQTYQAGGKTIYVYDGSNATWVNGGVWYQIQGQSSLTSDQLLRIANSI